LAVQVLLVALHGEGVVRILLLDEEPGVIALAVQASTVAVTPVRS
jgi:hypothetical protein